VDRRTRIRGLGRVLHHPKVIRPSMAAHSSRSTTTSASGTAQGPGVGLCEAFTRLP
jgi:hypothetical protein